MATSSREQEVNARIVFWGVAGAGKTTSLRCIHGKLRADHRGELKQLPTRLDPSVHYLELPIALGSVQGVRTQLQIVAVPGGSEHAHTRKQLLDQVDGLVLVLDSRGERLAENVACVEELRQSLAAYGRSLDELPVVLQYNKRDLADSFVIEDLHRRLGLRDAAVFETVATNGTGILQCLTTISKRVVRMMRDREPVETPLPPALREPEPESPSLTVPFRSRPKPQAESATLLMEAAILAEADDAGEAEAVARTVRGAQTDLHQPWADLVPEDKPVGGARIGADLKIVSVGGATRCGERAVRLPLVLGNDAGETVTLALTIQLDPLLDDETR
jgi:signal recognition particle receptor subunit beta